ncbi:hypothetical protein OJAV_G00113690 [Oryzias javanicus]|uniref:C-type lectin domain-containing protein n=1 Tax=Oryzias javanicus TaxID=123683 RepID=A0A3S2PQC3_ORYJA|nr:hypothetical protein OJAV_G00113690 [Oryzias javanicus]
MSAKEDRSDWKEREVDIYGKSNDVEVYYSFQQTETEPQNQSYSADREESKTLLRLKVLCVLMAAGIIILSICYLYVSLENNKMKNRLNQLETELSVTGLNNSHLQDEVKKLEIKIEEKSCPNGWIRFGSSCYYKSTFKATWESSRINCKNKGSDLVIINSTEEQYFITNLNENGESWIGLEVGWSSQKNKHGWIWLDGSPLTEIFQKTEKLQDPADYFSGVYLNAEKKWKSLHKINEKTFICER